jgi:hypothetical protein
MRTILLALVLITPGREGGYGRRHPPVVGHPLARLVALFVKPEGIKFEELLK